MLWYLSTTKQPHESEVSHLTDPLMSETIRSTVKKAARFAVYDETMMRVKNHQNPATIRVDKVDGAMSEPKCTFYTKKQFSTIDMVKKKIYNLCILLNFLTKKNPQKRIM